MDSAGTQPTTQLKKFPLQKPIKITSLKNPLTLIACYRPPSHSLSPIQWESLFKTIYNEGTFLLVGDFNALHPTWNCDTTNPAGENLHRLINKYNLIVHRHSHLSYNQHKNSNLDLIISQTDIAHLITTQQLGDTLGSDHFPIECILNTEKYIYQKKTDRLSIIKTNWDGYRKDFLFFNHFLGPDFSNMSPVDKYEDFVNKMKEFTVANTPNKPTKTQRSNPVSWWDTECNQAIRRCKASLKKWLHTYNMDDWLQYKKQSASCQSEKAAKKEKKISFQRICKQTQPQIRSGSLLENY